MGGDGVKEKVDQIPSKIFLIKEVKKREPIGLMCIQASSYGVVKTMALSFETFFYTLINLSDDQFWLWGKILSENAVSILLYPGNIWWWLKSLSDELKNVRVENQDRQDATQAKLI